MIVRILAFDPGTANTGHSLLLGDIGSSEISIGNFGVLRTSKMEHGREVSIRSRIDHLGDMINTLIYETKPTHIAMEDFVEQGKYVGKTYKEMSYLIEHMRLLGRQAGHEVWIFSNAFWKRKTLGISGTNKKQIQHYVAHNIPGAGVLLQGRPEHVWDSVGIGFCLFKMLVDRGTNDASGGTFK